jgi:hypothetical protein
MEKINLCDTCKYDFTTCHSKIVVFGCDVAGGDITDDNIVECDVYSNKS